MAEAKSNKVNMKTLAKVLNVSIATISKALRDSHDIGEETKQRVIETAKLLHYVPNPYASSLRKRSSNTIAIIIPEIADSFFSQAINGIESIVGQEKYHALIYLTHDSYEREAQMFNDLSSGRVDGVLMSVASNTKDIKHIQELQQAGVPIVFFDRVCEDIPTAKIKTDDFNSAYMATKHLLERGCKNISLVTIEGYPFILQAREGGYKKALAEYQIKHQEQNVISCSNKYNQENIAFLKEHIAKIKPDGIIATVEHLATTTYLACEELKMNIPNDVKVVCFTNQITAAILNPPLTTVLQPAYDMGRKAAELLFGHLAGKPIQLEKENITLPSKLVVRDSTRATD
ncbi:transcriptional regulator, LacI family [Mucilaginibacter lappiensis]|uniref:LacI family transcriptional regulator n=1 Tax=Mucilaginibacter lappiensis TaxID=354630 RepID=A0ABR6PDV1_9SPHI|nr:LacI family DNA-binding transcriptional regulator [Mucilaginibacter lappiensis]MBB6107937.1 LacI family transcriptional regulator [Mucilaginibacter lappiensis]SIP91941.1 transcriptional regulator, LacI family [Mucilaginibacter lappiensis]